MGAVAIDAIRRIQGLLGGCTSDSSDAWGSGALYWDRPYHGWKNISQPDDPGWPVGPAIDSGRVGPYGNVNRPRSLAVLACAYMGKPAS